MDFFFIPAGIGDKQHLGSGLHTLEALTGNRAAGIQKQLFIFDFALNIAAHLIMKNQTETDKHDHCKKIRNRLHRRIDTLFFSAENQTDHPENHYCNTNVIQNLPPSLD